VDELELRNTLKVERAIRNLTQAELGELAGARALGVSVNAIFSLAEGEESVAEPPQNVHS
jgi:hypothetical protein